MVLIKATLVDHKFDNHKSQYHYYMANANNIEKRQDVLDTHKNSMCYTCPRLV